jgi:hypothetical protein
VGLEKLVNRGREVKQRTGNGFAGELGLDFCAERQNALVGRQGIGGFANFILDTFRFAFSDNIHKGGKTV